MTEVFADTFYFVAILNPCDQHHAAVRSETFTNRFRIVTTTWVLVETANALRKQPIRGLVRRLIARILSDATVQVVADPVWFDCGLDLFGRRPDKDWSLTDCISFAVMTQRRMTHALTGDRHFAQAGFVPVFASSS